MFRFEQLTPLFAAHFAKHRFPEAPASLYEGANYFLGLGGKRVRAIACLMGAELFDNIPADAWAAATAIEVFHNFTLVHDDIMDRAALRRGQATVHARWGENTALLVGDVMLVKAYEVLSGVDVKPLHRLLAIFNQTAAEVCEGQQLDMDFEKREAVTFEEYEGMINLKTSVLLGAALKMGAVLGGASQHNQALIYEFGRKLGLAFQVQDDYLDAFGDPEKFGKELGGDIRANKKTFLHIHALEQLDANDREVLQNLQGAEGEPKVQAVLKLYKSAGVKDWSVALSQRYLSEALKHLEDIAVVKVRKQPLADFARMLVQREA